MRAESKHYLKKSHFEAHTDTAIHKKQIVRSFKELQGAEDEKLNMKRQEFFLFIQAG